MTDPLTYNAPLGATRAAASVARVLEVEPATVVDFGCGRGAFLVDVLVAGADVRGFGVDTDETALAAARQAAIERGAGDRVNFLASDAGAWIGGAAVDVDVAISVGATHAFGGLAPMLGVLPGRRIVVGDGFFARAPDEWCVETFGFAWLVLDRA